VLDVRAQVAPLVLISWRSGRVARPRPCAATLDPHDKERGQATLTDPELDAFFSDHEVPV
jgi:hypothetical protein